MNGIQPVTTCSTNTSGSLLEDLNIPRLKSLPTQQMYFTGDNEIFKNSVTSHYNLKQ